MNIQGKIIPEGARLFFAALQTCVHNHCQLLGLQKGQRLDRVHFSSPDPAGAQSPGGPLRFSQDWANLVQKKHLSDASQRKYSWRLRGGETDGAVIYRLEIAL